LLDESAADLGDDVFEGNVSKKYFEDISMDASAFGLNCEKEPRVGTT